MAATAYIAAIDNAGRKCELTFNPASLKVSLTNRLQDEDATGGGGQARQNTRVTTTKLETEIVFDTTEDGIDVRDKTKPLKDLAIAKDGNPKAPPKVEFRWGRFKYQGVIESLNETLDFWAAEGVPLRSTIQLVVQNVNGEADANVDDVATKIAFNTVPPGSTGTTGVATNAGDSAGGRAIAALNGIEDMRMALGGAVAVSAGVQLKAAAGFSLGAQAGVSIGAGASAGIGFGIGASAGAGASAGFGAGAGAGFGIGASAGFGGGVSAGFGAGASAGFGAGASAGFGAAASASFGASASAGFSAGATAGFASSSFASASFGASASAGITASTGAFAGLGVSKTTSRTFRLEPARLLPAPATVLLGSGTRFDVTGRAISGGSSGLSTDVSASAGIRFG